MAIGITYKLYTHVYLKQRKLLNLLHFDYEDPMKTVWLRWICTACACGTGWLMLEIFPICLCQTRFCVGFDGMCHSKRDCGHLVVKRDHRVSDETPTRHNQRSNISHSYLLTFWNMSNGVFMVGWACHRPVSNDIFHKPLSISFVTTNEKHLQLS